MENEPIRVLMVADNKDDYMLARNHLDKASQARFDLEWATTYETALEAMQQARHHAYLVDHRLGDRYGLDLLRAALANGCTAPIIMLTGQGDHALDMAAMQAGAADYVDKSQLGPQLLERSIRHAIERLQAGEALRKAEKKLEAIFSQSLDIILITDGKSGQILSVNRAIRHILGYEEESLIGKDFSALFPPEPERLRAEKLEELKTHGAVLESQPFLRADGSVCPMDLTAALIPWDKGKAILATLRDVTERKQAEEEREKLILELQAALAQVKTLRGLIPICASCQKIRDDEGYWHRVDAYIQEHSEAEFSHGICPDCAQELYPELFEDEE